jgi:transcriptional regulator with XRE-family HTH domain
MQSETVFFKILGRRIKHLREKAGYSQEDMVSHGFSVRYWQRIEAGKPITLRTLLRICRLFSAPMEEMVREVDVSGTEKQMARQAIQPRSKKAKK